MWRLSMAGDPSLIMANYILKVREMVQLPLEIYSDLTPPDHPISFDSS
jgi:hypothetical protein